MDKLTRLALGSTWKTILLGPHTNRDLKGEVAIRQVVVTEPAQQLLHQTVPLEQVFDFPLIRVRAGDLFEGPMLLLSAFYAAAEKQGLLICPPSVGPQLRIEYEDQPENEVIFIAMKPILDYEEIPRVFRLEHPQTIRRLDALDTLIGAFQEDIWVFLDNRSGEMTGFADRLGLHSE